MKTTTFSNGYIDTYKGKRDVKAGWAVFNKATGEMIDCGHSLDRATAERTVKANTRYWAQDVIEKGHEYYYGKDVNQYKITMGEATRRRQFNKARIAYAQSLATVEIVDVVES